MAPTVDVASSPRPFGLRPRELGIALATAGFLLMSLESPGLRLTELGSWENTFWLGLFSALSMFSWIRVRTGKSPLAAARDHRGPMLLSAALQAASTLSFILAIHHTTIANIQVLFAATPAVGALLAQFTLGERASARTWLAIVASIAGMLIVVSGSWGSATHGSIAGDLFALLAMGAYTANLAIWRKVPDLNREAVVGLGGVIMAACAVLAADLSTTTWRGLAIVVLLGMLSAPFGRVLVAIATRHLPVAQVSLLTPVETVAATTWAWLFLDEVPSNAALLGGAIVLAAVSFGLRE